MTTATAEAPASIEQELDLTSHAFDSDGACREPEIVAIPVPKKCVCEIRLARSAALGWHFGYNLAVGQESKLDVFPHLGHDVRPTRDEALGAALAGARDFFQASPKSREHKLCAKAVVAAAAKLAQGSPANIAKAKPGPLPEPTNQDLPVARLEAHPQNPRGEIKEADVAELAQTIKAQGLLQPVGVRIIRAEGDKPGINGGRLQLLWGHRRVKAFKVLKLEAIACRVYENISDDQARLVMSIENDEREDLDPIKRAKNYAAMMADFEMTQDDVAGALKKSRPVIANALRLLELPAGVQDLLASGKLTNAHGTALARFKDWPKVCEKIAELTAKTGASANSLEKNLPFAEELVEAKLAVDLCGSINYDVHDLDLDQVKKLAKSHPGVFAWHDSDQYEDYGLTLDLELGKRLKEEEEKKAEKSRKEYEEREQSNRRNDSGELTPAAKKARQKKLDGNLKNRLECAAMEHAALERLSLVRSIDIPSLLIICSEALKHDCHEIEDVAKRIGLDLPKDFDDGHEWGSAGRDHALESLAKIEPAEALALCAAALLMRDAAASMRFASGVPPFVQMGAQPTPAETLDAASYVQEWHNKILPLVKNGMKAEQIRARLECPDFIAVQLTRSIKRDLREAGVPILSPEDAATIENSVGPALGMYRTLLRDQGDKTNGELAKQFEDAATAKKDIAAVRNLIAQEQAWEKACKPAPEPAAEKKDKPKAAKKSKAKPAKKAAPAKAKKGAKKK